MSQSGPGCTLVSDSYRMLPVASRAGRSGAIGVAILYFCHLIMAWVANRREIAALHDFCWSAQSENEKQAAVNWDILADVIIV